MLRHLLGFSFFLCMSLSAAAQYPIRGVVVDAESNKPLPFVNILINDSQQGLISDIDGRFSINQPEPIRKLRLSYVGYHNLNYVLEAGVERVSIRLERKSLALEEVQVVAGENPAHRIIRETLKQRNNNHPEKLNSFQYTAYNRFVLSIDTNTFDMVDSVEAEIKISKTGDTSLVYDSSYYEFSQFFRARDMFITESVSERSFIAPDLSYDKVIASRTSGIRNPLFLLLSNQLQSFSFYDDHISILSIRYLNPISPNSTSRYFYHIEDTLYDASDTIFVISFKPREGKNIDGMKGLLYINTGGYAIQHVLAEPADSLPGFSIRIRQRYERIQGERWFPVQLNTDIRFTNEDLEGAVLTAESRSYLQDIVINPPIKKRDIKLQGAEILRDATEKPIGYWEPFRREVLTERDEETYRFIDSISAQYKLERRLRWALALQTGRFPVGPIDIRLRDVLRVNRYEGIRLGMGLQTNDVLSRWVSVGGYAAWGFRDKSGKYGANFDINLDPLKKYSLQFYGHNELAVSGGYQLYQSETAFFSQNPDRLIYWFNRFFDREQAMGARFNFKNWRYFSGYVDFKGSYRRQSSVFNYRFLPLVPGYEIGAPLPEAAAAPGFNYRELGINLRYAFREKTIRTTDREFTIENRYPVVQLSYQKGFAQWGGEWDYHRLVARVEKSFAIRNFGYLTTFVTGAAVFSDSSLPIQQLFFVRGTGINNGLYVPLSFQTFDMHERGGNHFVHLGLRHNFGSKFLKTPKQQPILAFHHNSGYSRFLQANDHLFLAADNFPARIADMPLGYHESGFTISNIRILNGSWGFGFFYRFGAYHLPGFMNNAAFKLAIAP